ncbi:compass component swd1 [Kwoniella heveanensis CBS 569]|nr:compass component swd1 [Kwoniella heveanensis CBS 569]
MQQLLNPFAQKYPEAVDSTLSSQAVSVLFNPYGPFAGHYLAVGGSDGIVEVWDVETRGVIRVLEGHVKAVGGLSWSRNNRYLLTSSHDATAIIWDLSVLSHPSIAGASARAHTIRFDAPVASAVFHPRNSRIILATLTCGEIVLVDLRDGSKTVLKDEVEGEDEDQDEGAGGSRKRNSMACAVFSPCGSRIYAGTTGGVLLVIDPLSKYVLQRVKVANAAIRQLRFDASGHHIILSASDRALRLLSVDPISNTLTPLHRFQDLVNRSPWHAIGFSGDGEYVMGGAGHKMAHNVFVWDRESTVLIKVLEGPKEPLVDCDWHPTRPVIASVATSGDVHIWQTSSPDNWAAFAPGFEELEENIEYDEREDEFDIEDETDLARRKDLEEDLEIDVLTIETDAYPRLPNPLSALSLSGGEINLDQMAASIPDSKNPASDSDLTEERAAAIAITRNVQAVRAVRAWAEKEGDDDTWEGFYQSLDLLEDIGDENEDGS